jgi:GT2 family glycosyltransferase
VKRDERIGTADPTQPSVSVLCVTHGRRDLLLQCIESCDGQNYRNKEIIIVFNPNDPETERIVKNRFPNVCSLGTDQNIGFFPALNLAIAESAADYLMIVDDDAHFLRDDALAALVKTFENEPRLGAVTCTLEGPREKPADRVDRYISVFTTGFTMFPRRAVTEWVGYFPKLFFRSAGETFLCTQLWEQLRPVKRLSNVRMFHALAVEGRSIRDWRFYGLRSQLLCAVMREPATWLGPVLLSKLMKSFSQYIGYRQPGLWLKAWASFLFHLPEAIRQRRPISTATRAFLRFLDKTTVTNLDESPEWRHLVRAQRTANTGQTEPA